MSEAIAEAHRRLEALKEEHKQRMFEDVPDDAAGVLTQSRDQIIADVCEEVQEFFPEPEPEPVRRYRAVLLTMDSVDKSDLVPPYYDNPIHPMQNIAIQYRKEALTLIENRLVLEKPTEEGDADVLYIYDPVSKLRRTTALGGYKEEYDKAMIEGQKKMLAEQILNDPIPDTVPRL